MSAKGPNKRERWNALPPKPCPSCARVLPRTEFYTSGGKCKRCYQGHRVTQGTDQTTQSRRRRGEVLPSGQQSCGVDYLSAAQRELFPGRDYRALTREQCGAVRRRALELLTANTPASEVAA